MVDKAHGMGIRVLLDIVHSHASNNIDDGLNGMDFGQDVRACHLASLRSATPASSFSWVETVVQGCQFV